MPITLEHPPRFSHLIKTSIYVDLEKLRKILAKIIEYKWRGRVKESGVDGKVASEELYTQKCMSGVYQSSSS